MKRLSVLAILALGLLVQVSWAQTKSMKIAYIPCGRVNDKSWSEAEYIGALAGKKALEEKAVQVQLDYSESLPVAKVETASRDYASRGHNPVILHCGTFAEAALRAAKDFPNTWFLVAATPLFAKNVAAYDPAQHEGSFVMGYLAGLMTKTNRVAAIGGFDFPALTRQVEGFKFGARYANPKVKVFSTYIDSWEDAAKAKEAALAQIEGGADVVFAATDQAARGVFSAAQERKVYAIASYEDQAAMAPDTILTSVLYDTPLLVKQTVLKVHDASIEGKVYKVGMAGGIGHFAPYYKMEKVILKEVQDKVAKLIEDIKAGRIMVPEFIKPGLSDKEDPQKVLKR